MNDYIHRKIEETILEASKYFSVIAVSGPRQSGKSTLLTQLFPLYEKYSLKDLNILDYAKNDPIAFLNQTDEGMFIDEIQRCPQLLDYIQGIVDNNPKRHFALSGSSNFEVMKNLSESLAGRAGVFELLPMSIQEVTGKVDLDNLNQILYNGLYPSICAKKNIAKFFYPSYVRTYLEKDV
ncbi:ATP-binding protein, partial [Prevotella jejuni]